MTAERRQKIKAIFQSALQLELADRPAFLLRACEGDEVLRNEVDALLAGHEKDGSFLNSTAVGQVSDAIFRDRELKPGQQVGHYEIISKLGEGGMGEVYLAQDQTLRRRVALKLLPLVTAHDAVAQKRLLREAQAAATLDHPNICAIYEVGEANGRSYIAMQYVEGQALDARLAARKFSISETLNIALEVADALSDAHARGIIHRDIKPSNIVLNHRGHAKVLDFGLAKLTVTEASDEAKTLSLVTSQGTIVGTVPYMSPEQVRGERLDAATDIFSFGVMLYEMLSGQSPFAHESVAETIVAILHRDPPQLTSLDPEIPKALEDIVGRCLVKDKRERYPNMRGVATDLMAVRNRLSAQGSDDTMRQATRPAPMRKRTYIFLALIAGLVLSILAGVTISKYRKAAPANLAAVDSIAVLPLFNSSKDQNMEYLSDGVTESLINSLSKIPKLKVMSRNAVFRYKGKESDAQKVGKELGVRAVLKGDIRQIGNELLVNIELVSSEDNSHLWGENFAHQESDVIGMQNEIARRIITSLRVQLSGPEEAQLNKRPTNNPEAYKLYLKARYVGQRGDAKSAHESINYYREAINLDPTFALAYSDLGLRHLGLGMYYEPPRELMPKAKAYATRALELDNSLSDPHSVLGLVALLYDWDWDKAAKHLVTGGIVAPQNLDAFTCTAHLLESTGRVTEAERTLKLAMEADPLSLALKTELGCAGYYTRRFDESIKDYRETLKLEQRNMEAYWGLGRALGQKKQYDDALKELLHVQELYGEMPPLILGEIGYVYGKGGKRAQAERTIRELEEKSQTTYVDPYFVSIVFLALNDKNKALTWLEKAYQARSSFIVSLNRDPKWDELRNDSRFTTLVQRLGVKSYPWASITPPERWQKPKERRRDLTAS